MKKLKNIAIIPARGGSKRIPRKNIKDFLGKPIIAYSIEAALKSNLFDEVMVSTDDDEIASIAKQYGAKVPFMRSKENADDYATLADVLIEVVEEYVKIDIQIENICCVLPTAPLLDKQNLIDGYNQFYIGNKDSLISIVEFSFPVLRSFVKAKDNSINFSRPEFEKSRSQDLEKHFHDAGQFYWIKSNELLKGKSLMTYNTGYIELSSLEVQDIDTCEDWQITEMKYKILNAR